MATVMGERINGLAYGAGNPSLVSLFTSLFIHADPFHIFFNMLFLWVFGPPVEDRVGTKLFFIYYIGAGVAANVLDALVHAIHNPGSSLTGIGASGAISGIMALYLYRCYYSKVKMVVTFYFLPFNLNIPAIPIVMFWFLKDIFYAFITLSKSNGIGHWAHVGGFLFGLAVGRIKRYGHASAMEHYSGKVDEELRKAGKWQEFTSESDLLKLADLEPDNPRIRLQLAQFYTAKKEIAKADEYYRDAFQKYFLKTPLFGAFTVLEYQDALGKTADLQYHVKAADVLSSNGFAEESYLVLSRVLGEAKYGPLAEKAHLLNVKICMELGRQDEAQEACKRFEILFQRSSSLATAAKALTLKPGEIFPKKKLDLAEQTAQVFEEPEDVTASEAFIANRFNSCVKHVTDPLFFVIFFTLLPLLLIVNDMAFAMVFVLPIAYFATALYRINWTEVYRKWKGVDEEGARKESDISTLYNKACLSERCENYPKAAELYEKLLFLDSKNFQARFSLARIYQNKLDDRHNALMQYRKLFSILPEDHPYYHDTDQAIKTLGVKNFKREIVQ